MLEILLDADYALIDVGLHLVLIDGSCSSQLIYSLIVELRLVAEECLTNDPVVGRTLDYLLLLASCFECLLVVDVLLSGLMVL